jgi:hypothetical protein
VGVRAGAPLLSIERISYTFDGVPVEHSHDLFRGDRTRVIAWVNPGDVPEERLLKESSWASRVGL